MGDDLLRADRLRTYLVIRTGLLGGSRVLRAVDGVSLSIPRGKTLALVGESGGGKSTLGKTLLLLHRPHEGKILFDGRDITKLGEGELKWYRREAQIIHQDPYSSINPYYTVEWIVSEPLITHNIGSGRGERREIALRALEEVRLEPAESFAAKYPHMLSGGQRQRVVIARAMVLRPRFLVADEPVSMLDASVRVEILELLRDLQSRRGVAMLYITHDVSTAKYFSHELAVMYAGKIVEMGETRSVISEPLHPYTQSLIEAIPDPDPSNRFRERRVIPGEPPSLISPPSGCRFHPRCPYATERCVREEPELREVSPGRLVSCHLY